MSDPLTRQQKLGLLRGRPPRRESGLEAAQQRLDFLSELVVELLIEVEALREAQIATARAAGLRGRDTPYGAAWRQTVELSHNSAGFSDGIEKLLARWPENTEDHRGQGTAREVSMLQRLGYEPAEIDAFVGHLDSLEALT